MVPQSAGRPPSPTKVEKMVSERSLPSGSHLWRMLPDWGLAMGVSSSNSNDPASLQGPLETAAPGPTKTEIVGGEAWQSLGEHGGLARCWWVNIKSSRRQREGETPHWLTSTAYLCFPVKRQTSPHQ